MNLRCVNLESGLRIENDGTCKSCCMMKDKFWKTKREKYNLYSDTFDDIMKSKARRKIVKALEKGEKHPACQRCWDEEATGKKSKRLRDNETFIDTKPGTVQIIDVSMGTQCNIKCRTCGPFNSSFWNNEWFDTGYFGGTKEEYKSYLKRLNCAFDDDSSFWDQFKQNLKNTLHIDFYGGEPFLVKKQWNMLEYAIEHGYSKDIAVHYNTNGTIWNDSVYDILKEFKAVYIDFSIDGVYDKLTYIRYPAKWDTVYNNLLKLKEVSDKDTKFKINICNTISILNVYYIPEMYEVFAELGNSMYLNLVFGPDYYCIKNIPKPIKKEITQHLENSEERYWTTSILNFMNGNKDNPKEWERFLKITKKHDEYRGQSFKEIFPEFYDIIKKNGFSL